MPKNSIPYEKVKARALAKPGVKEAYDELDPAYQLACLRIASGLTQAELAGKAGCHSQRSPRREIEVALRRMADFLEGD